MPKPKDWNKMRISVSLYNEKGDQITVKEDISKIPWDMFRSYSRDMLGQILTKIAWDLIRRAENAEI